ncbi:MAG: type II toxin-antitoxin system RelE/ParE family toxin [Nitrospiria bacterium]
MTAGGRSPVESYIDRLPKSTKAEILAAFRMIEKYGLTAPVSMRQNRGKLWELRLTQTRLFYFCLDSDLMILLHAYKKQGQKAPQREIETALRRMSEFIE